MATFANLVSKARTIAKVDASVVSQSSGEEEELCKEALRTYSQARPFVDAVEVAQLAAGADPVWNMADIVSGWVEDAHQVIDLYRRVGGERFRIPGLGWTTLREAGVTKLCLDFNPGFAFYVRYGGEHLSTDSPFKFPLADLDAISHLAAALILESAANFYGRQYGRTVPADSSNVQEQSYNYALRAKDQRKLYQDAIKSRPSTNSGFKRANWSSRGMGGRKDKFWDSRYD